MPTDQDEIAALAARIRQYLEEHPAAADTLDGIVCWWLPCQGNTHTLASVERALEVLTVAGIVEKLKRSDGHVIYRRAPRGPGGRPPPAGQFDA